MLGPGTIVGDKYRLERVLGRGGMGLVVEARHVQLGTSFALKFLYTSILAKPSLAERFLREARATAALKSEHVCRVFDVGSFEDMPYIVMERLEGVDLAQALRQWGPVPLSAACDYLIQACAGVAEAHAANIVHRDLKPGNLFMTERADGTPLIKILDFGIAKAPQDDNFELTGPSTILGSPAYMSLEQLRSSKLVDARSDIWSLGVILFELVSGQKPFAGENVADLALRIAMSSVPRLFDVPPELDAIIARCLAQDPAQRYQSVGELARALAPFADEPARRLAASIGRMPRAASPVAAIVASAGRAPGRLATEPGASVALPAVSVAMTSRGPTRPLSGVPVAVSSVVSTAPVPAVPVDVRPTVPLRAPAPLSPTLGGHARALAELATREPPPPSLPPPPSAAIGAREPMLPVLLVPRLAESDPSQGDPGRRALGTTMQTAGVIENAASARGPRRRVGAIVAVMGISVGILLGVVAAGEDDAGSTALPAAQPIEPAVAAPSPPPPPPAVTPPATVPDAAVPAPEEAPEIKMEPAPDPPVEPPPASPSKQKPRPKPTRKDLSKSRI